MTILILLALFVLAVVFAVFFLIFKVGWLIFKKNTYRGPLIAAGVCTFLLTLAVGTGCYKGYQRMMSPFRAIIARVQANPTPVYGERTYADDTYPFTLTVYDGMDFSNWMNLAGVQLKIGIDTNAFKKDATGHTPRNVLLSVLVRQPNASANTFAQLQEQLNQAQQQRRLEIYSSQEAEMNGLLAYQAQGEAYSNQGKLNFWLTALQTPDHTVYYIVALALRNDPSLAEPAQHMIQSFNLTPPN